MLLSCNISIFIVIFIEKSKVLNENSSNVIVHAKKYPIVPRHQKNKPSFQNRSNYYTRSTRNNALHRAQAENSRVIFRMTLQNFTRSCEPQCKLLFQYLTRRYDRL